MQEVRGSNPLTSTKVLVYILQSESNGQFYVGHTSNLEDRLLRHNSSRSIATKGKGPWRVVFTQEFETRSEASIREREIKNWKSKARIEELISRRASR